MRVHLMLLSALLVTACAPRLIAFPEPTQIPPSVKEERLPTETASVETDKLLSVAVMDLSTRFSLEPVAIRVLSIEPRLWQDTSLGCPRPGEVYTQQPVHGYQIRLRANGQEFAYHTDTNKMVILCVEKELPSFPVTPGEIDDDQPWMPVD